MSSSSDADPQTTALILNATIGSAITLISLVLFDLFRKRVPSVFEARRSLNAAYSHLDYFSARVSYPSSPSYRLFGWVGPVIRIELKNVTESHGLDTALYLRYLKAMAAFFLFLCSTSLLLLPVYFTAGNKDLPPDDLRRTIGINRFSLANLQEDDPWRFWVTFAIEIVITVATCHFLASQFAYYSAVRIRYRSSRNPANYAILVQDIPPISFSEGAVLHYWSKLFPKDIEKVYIIHDGAKLQAKIAKFWTAVTKRERAEWELQYNPKLDGARPTHKAGCCSCLKKNSAVDSIEYWSEKQTHYSTKIALYQHEIDTKHSPPTYAAIVVFKTRLAASVAAQTHFASKHREWRVSRAPEPNAINWKSLAIPNWQLPFRNAATVLSAILLTLFWIIPVTAIMALTNLSSLASIEIAGKTPFSFLDSVSGWPAGVLGLIEGLLPAIILSVFLGLVPTFLRIFVNFSRVTSMATVDTMVRDWYFNFVVFSNFLFVAFAGTLLDDLQEIIQAPTTVVDKLAAAIPKQGAFIMNFVLLKALSESPQELMQIARVVIRWIMLKFLAKTPREKGNVDTGNTVFEYLRYYSIAQLVAFLGMIYSTIQPFISVVCFAYFAVNYVVWKYNLCFSMHNPYQDGGRMFGGALYGLWAGLFLHQLTMIGLFSLNKNPAQAILILIPAVLSVLFLRYCRINFDRVVDHGSATESTLLIEDEGREDMIEETLARKFIHPGFDPLPNPVENQNGVDGNDEGLKGTDLDDLENPAFIDGLEGGGDRLKPPKSMSSEEWKDAYATSNEIREDAPL